MTLYARIKSGTVPPYLTEGKEYKARMSHFKSLPVSGRSFYFKDDEGLENFANENSSQHLSGGDWELIEKPEAKE